MATQPLPQVSSDSFDLAGITLCTATRTLSDPRAGTIWDLTTMAAASPVWFHALPTGQHLMVNSRRWHTATPAPDLGYYESFVEDTTPSWAIVHGPTGRRTSVPGFPMTVPMDTAVTSPVLTAAASRSPDHLYLLNSGTLGGESVAVIQRIHVLTTTGAVFVSAEEVLPTVEVGDQDVVVFVRGVQFTPLFLVLHGTDTANRIYRMRKPWSHIGVNRPQSRQIYETIVGSPQGWEYWMGTGYSFDPAEAVPLVGPTTVGPMSFATDPDRSTVLMSTVEYIDSAYVGRVWTSAAGRPFRQHPTEVPLGDDSTYLGGGIQFQPELRVTPVPGVRVSIPYLTSVLSEDDGNSSLVNTWAVWSVD